MIPEKRKESDEIYVSMQRSLILDIRIGCSHRAAVWFSRSVPHHAGRRLPYTLGTVLNPPLLHVEKFFRHPHKSTDGKD